MHNYNCQDGAIMPAKYANRNIAEHLFLPPFFSPFFSTLSALMLSLAVSCSYLRKN